MKRKRVSLSINEGPTARVASLANPQSLGLTIVGSKCCKMLSGTKLLGIEHLHIGWKGVHEMNFISFLIHMQNLSYSVCELGRSGFDPLI